MTENPQLRKTIVTTFKFNGLSIKGEACDYLIWQLSPLTNDQQQSWLDKVIEYLQTKKTLGDPVVEKHHVKSAVEECCKLESNAADDIISVIDVFNIPRFRYDPDHKKFVPLELTRLLFDNASCKIQLFAERYVILKQRIVRHELLTSNSATQSENEQIKLREIDFLLSCASDNVNVVVFGLLSQLEEGKYYLEDPTGILPLNISQTVYHAGLFTEYCLVLAEGVFSDGVLNVHGLGMPPPESSKISRSYFGNVDTFCGISDFSFKTSSRLLKIEKDNEEAMIVFLSDIWLDKNKIMEKLKMLFSGYNDYAPEAIILMGNFLSKPYGSQHSHLLREKFKELAEIIAGCDNLIRETLIVVIPGPTDSPFANILPRPALPSYITQEFTKRVPKTIFATNPARIRYCTQEIVAFREDILTKMCRNTIYYPTSGEISSHFVKTILSQCYLTPISLSVCPVYWNESSALTLYPLPDVLIIADQRSPFNMVYKDCVVLNPGSFSSQQYGFKVYMPATKQVEDCQITADVPV